MLSRTLAHILARSLALCSLLVLVAACGQKGPLRLPDESAAGSDTRPETYQETPAS